MAVLATENVKANTLVVRFVHAPPASGPTVGRRWSRVSGMVVAILLLAGCVSHRAWYIHRDTQEVAWCASEGWGWAGAAIAVDIYATCKTRLERHGFRREPDSYAEIRCSQTRCYDGVSLGVSLYRCEQQGLTGAARYACEERRLEAIRAGRLSLGSLADICAPKEYWDPSAGKCLPQTIPDCAPTEYWSASAYACAPR
jgi:hypothetical protein